jgi:hypothetical protein
MKAIDGAAMGAGAGAVMGCAVMCITIAVLRTSANLIIMVSELTLEAVHLF